jgi:integrase
VSIRTRNLSGGRRVYDVMLRRPDGTQYQRTFRTKKEAESWEAQQRADRSRSQWVDPTAGRVVFKEYSWEWLRARPDLRPKTIELYASELRLHLVPTFGAMSLAEISLRDVRTWHAALTRSRSQVTAAKCYRLLSAIMNTAVDDGLVASSPCRVKGAGIERSRERPLPSVEVALAIADAIAPRYKAFVLLAAFCGLRVGELGGLTRGDLDLLHRTVTVSKQLQELENGSLVVSPPKSDAGTRVVNLPAAIVPALEDHLMEWAEPGVDGRVFVGERGGHRRLSFYKAWSAARAACGVSSDVHPHDLRHLANTLAARVPGTTTKDLMVRIGHASPRAALRYLHASPEADRAISHGIDAAIRASQEVSKGDSVDEGQSEGAQPDVG